MDERSCWAEIHRCFKARELLDHVNDLIMVWRREHLARGAQLPPASADAISGIKRYIEIEAPTIGDIKEILFPTHSSAYAVPISEGIVRSVAMGIFRLMLPR